MGLHGIRTVVLVAVLTASVAAAGSAQPAAVRRPEMAERLHTVEQWLEAVRDHEPGTTDQAASLVASWSTRTVRTLWIDANAIAQLMLNLRRTSISIQLPGQRGTSSIRYGEAELHRLRVLACAAGGTLASPECVAVNAAREATGDLIRVADAALASAERGDRNYLLRHAALLHTDIAMFMRDLGEPVSQADHYQGPQRIRIQTSDGTPVDLSQFAPHWEFARMMLDYIRPPGADNPAPGLDDMVRLWYRATAAWMQAREQHDTEHLVRAREIFPHDPDILFLSACQHEAYASASIQSVAATAYLPRGITSAVGSERSELHQAERFFRQALSANGSLAEAHLRLGHVLVLLDRHAEAVPELGQALASVEDDWLRYYGRLFLGAAHEALREYDDARHAYAGASELFPKAQSPKIALSGLARRRGDRAGALRDLQPLLDKRVNADDDDPWWHYFVAQARNADDLFDRLRQPFRDERP